MLWNPIPLWRGVLRRRGTGYTYTKPAQIRVHVHLCCCTNNVSRLSHPIKSFIYDSRPFWGGTPLIKKAHRGCDSSVSQNSRLVLHTYIITTTTYTWHPNDCCFNWKRHCFGMLLEASTTKIEDKYLYIYIYRRTYLYMCIMLIYTMFSLLPTYRGCSQYSQGKVRIVKAIISWGSPKWKSEPNHWSVWKDNRSRQWSFLHLYIVYVQFFCGKEWIRLYIYIYHTRVNVCEYDETLQEWTLWMKSRCCIKVISYLVSKLAVIVRFMRSKNECVW